MEMRYVKKVSLWCGRAAKGIVRKFKNCFKAAEHLSVEGKVFTPVGCSGTASWDDKGEVTITIQKIN